MAAAPKRAPAAKRKAPAKPSREWTFLSNHGHVLVHEFALIPASPGSPVEAEERPTMRRAHRFAHEAVVATEVETVGPAAGDGRLHEGERAWRKDLVAVEVQDPLVPALREREVFLRREAQPILVHDAREIIS